jgi:CHAD domain-containing protein
MPGSAALLQLYERVLADGLGRLEQHWAGAGLGDEVAIHQTRVALRRMRSHIRMLEPWAATSWAQPLIADLAALAAILGPLRDLDVLGTRLRLAADDGGAEGDPGLVGLRRRQEAQRAAALDTARRLLASDATGLQLDRAMGAVSAPQLSPTADLDEVRIAALDEAWRRLDKTVSQLKAKATDERLHRVRIKVKRLRYAAAAFSTSPEDPYRRTAKRAAKVQSILGELNDAAFAEAWLVDAAEGPSLEAFVAGRLVERERSRATTARATWRSAFEGLRDAATTMVGDQDPTP